MVQYPWALFGGPPVQGGDAYERLYFSIVTYTTNRH